MKKTFLVLVLAFVCFGFKCGGAKNHQPPADPSASEWEKTRSVSSQNGVFNLPAKRPAAHVTSGGARVYRDGTIVSRYLQEFDAGLDLTLFRCLRDQKDWVAPDGKPYRDAWRTFTAFKNKPDFSLIAVDTPFKAETPDIKGCPMLPTGVPELYTCGTISGWQVTNGKIVFPGGAYLILPYYDGTDEACWNLIRNCAAHEAEHLVFSNQDSLFMSYVNDANGISLPDGTRKYHPYCTGME